jgi:hypothetical protein
MYPQSELRRLAAYKATLRRDIHLRRATCAIAAGELARPFLWLERVWAFGRQLAPLAAMAAVPLGWLLTRSPAPKPRLLGSLLRWGPILFGLVRGLSRASTRESGR